MDFRVVTKRSYYVIILHWFFLFVNSQVISQVPNIDGVINTDWTPGSELSNLVSSQWNVQWTSDTFYIGTRMTIPVEYDHTKEDLTVRFFFDSVTPRPKYNTSVTGLGTTGLSNFQNQTFPFPLMVDVVITCQVSLADGASDVGNCTRYTPSGSIWNGNVLQLSHLFQRNGTNVTFEGGIFIRNITTSTGLRTAYFIGDSILVNRSSGAKILTLTSVPSNSSEYYGFPFLASSTISPSYPPANFPCYLSHYPIYTVNSTLTLSWSYSSTWYDTWIPDSGALDTVVILDSSVTVSGVTPVVACVVLMNGLTVGTSSSLTVNNLGGKDGTSYFWSTNPGMLHLNGTGNLTIQAPGLIQAYSNIYVDGPMLIFESKTGNYSQSENTIQFEPQLGNSSAFFESASVVTKGPVLLKADSMPFKYLVDDFSDGTKLYIQEGSFPGSYRPSGVEWDPMINENLPFQVYINSVAYDVSVRGTFGASGNIFVEGAGSLVLRADGNCTGAFEPCVAICNKLSNPAAPVLIDGIELKINSNEINVTNVECIQEGRVWTQGTFLQPIDYIIEVPGTVNSSSVSVQGISNINFTFLVGSSDTALVNVTNSDYSAIVLSKLDFNSSGSPISESVVSSSNNTAYQFNATSIGSYRIKLYDIYGCLSYVVVNVAAISPPTPSVIPTSSASPSTPPDFHSSSNSSDNSVFIGAVSGAVVGTLVFSALIVAAAFFIKKRRNNKDSFHKEDMEGPSANLEMKPVVAETSTPPSKTNYSKGAEWDIKFSEIQVGQELGRGAFGVVYKCRWRNTDCVVKQLDINKNDDHSIQQFLKEANNVRNLRSHPNVCTIFGVCTDPQYPICIVMEYLPEGSLDHLVYQDQSEFQLNLESFFDFAKDIASGMSHLHAENILHCDLACRNLLLAAKPIKGQNNYSIKIADFGLSRISADEYSASNDATFPVRWSAPETLKVNRVSRASDVFSFGVVLWEIAEGKRPWLGMSNQAVVEAVVYRNERLLAPTRLRLPTEVWDLVVRCWSAQPQDRPSFNEIYAILINLEQSCLDSKAQQAKKIQEMLLEEQQRTRVISSDGSSSSSSNNNNNNNNNNYGFALKKLSENISTESAESTGQTASFQLPEPIIENLQQQSAIDSNYTQSLHDMPTAEIGPQIDRTGEEYLNTTDVITDDYMSVPTNKK